MKLFLNHPLKWGFLVFFVVLFSLRPFAQPTTCSDGWQSPSIGKRGACSWHGGVGTNWSVILIFGAAAISGLTVGGAILVEKDKRRRAEWEREKIEREAREQAELEASRERAKAQGITCPNCGCEMVTRTARRGRNRLNRFRGCSRYPKCTGTRPMPELSDEDAAGLSSDRDGLG